jgi:electron transfer flavoprotein alpha subunit
VFAVPRSIAKSFEKKDIAPRSTPDLLRLEKADSIQVVTELQEAFLLLTASAEVGSARNCRGLHMLAQIAGRHLSTF